SSRRRHTRFSRDWSSDVCSSDLTGANMYAGLLLIPLYLQLVAGQTLPETGLWILVMGLGSAFVLPVAGALTDRFGARLVVTMGAGLLLLSTLPFLSTEVPSSMTLGVILAVRGAGMALAQMPAMTAAYGAVSGREMGDATTLVNIVQRVGGAVGAVGVVIILQHISGSASQDGYIWAFAALAILSACTLVS